MPSRLAGVLALILFALPLAPAGAIPSAPAAGHAGSLPLEPLLLIGFECEPGAQPRDAWIPVAIEEFLVRRLRRVPELTVIPTVRAYQAWRDLADPPGTPPDWLRTGRLLGARRWLTGRCRGVPDQLEVALELRELSADAPARQLACVRVGPGRLAGVLDQATQWALAELGVFSLASGQQALLLAAPSRSEAAVEYYARAIEAVRSEQTRNAVSYVQQAVELDPAMRPAQLILAQLEVHISDRARASAATRLRHLRELARHDEDRLDLAQIELTEGLLLASKGSYDVAALRLKTALTWARECREVYTELAAMTNLCDVYLSRRPPDEADEAARKEFLEQSLREAAGWQEQALERLRSLGDVVTEAPTANKLALIYERLGQPDRALELHRRTIEAAVACGSRRTEATGWMFLGQFYRTQKRYAEALQAAEKCLALAEPAARPGVLIALADIHSEMQRPQEALAHYEEANRQLMQSEDFYQQVLCLRRIAALRDQLQQRPAAIAALREARDIAHALRLPEEAEIDRQLREWGDGPP